MQHQYRELIVWQKSMVLVKELYNLSAHFPSSEVFSLTNQMRRAAVSIPSNIAEGSARGHIAEFIQFLRIAFGSGAELETQLQIAKELGYGNSKDYSKIESQLAEVMKMLNVFTHNLVSKKSNI